jgi:hypothetical protein
MKLIRAHIQTFKPQDHAASFSQTTDSRIDLSTLSKIWVKISKQITASEALDYNWIIDELIKPP